MHTPQTQTSMCVYSLLPCTQQASILENLVSDCANKQRLIKSDQYNIRINKNPCGVIDVQSNCRIPLLDMSVDAGRPAEVDAEAGRDRPAMAAEEEEPPVAFLYENGGPAQGQDPMDSIWREAARCDEQGESSAHVCSGRKEHGIPVPATELGDTALVTTKTVQ